MLHATDDPQQVDIPAGSTFANASAHAQPLILCRDYTCNLSPGETRRVELDGYCGASSFGCPSPSDSISSPAWILGGFASGALLSQSTVWSYLDPYTPQDVTLPYDVQSSAQYREEHAEEFADFDEHYSGEVDIDEEERNAFGEVDLEDEDTSVGLDGSDTHVDEDNAGETDDESSQEMEGNGEDQEHVLSHEH